MAVFGDEIHEGEDRKKITQTDDLYAVDHNTVIV